MGCSRCSSGIVAQSTFKLTSFDLSWPYDFYWTHDILWALSIISPLLRQHCRKIGNAYFLYHNRQPVTIFPIGATLTYWPHDILRAFSISGPLPATLLAKSAMLNRQPVTIFPIAATLAMLAISDRFNGKRPKFNLVMF